MNTHAYYAVRRRAFVSFGAHHPASGGAPKAYGDYAYEYAPHSNRLNRILLNGAPHEILSYDTAGRLIERNHATQGKTTYAYDDRNLLTQAITPTATVSYTYDALGVRKSKTVNGQTTLYLTAPVFGMSHVLMELAPDLTVKASYVYGGHQQLIEEPVAADRSKDLYLLHDGTVGNITHATTRTATITNSYRYEPFGARTPQAPATAGRYGYTGEEYDTETGLVYLRARYYDPALGRFISPDPFLGRLAEPITQNRYVYVKNNPLGFTDPEGLEARFGKRPLEGMPFMINSSIDDSYNTEISHEQLFFGDGKMPSNVGFFSDGRVRADQNYPGNKNTYEISGPSYSDMLMRSAYTNVTPEKYCLIGNNCQDWSDKVRNEYNRQLNFFSSTREVNQCPAR